MSPEEKALKVCKELKGADYDPEEWIEAKSPDVLEAVTTAIRDAEDEALERAAELITKFLSGSELSKPIATVIRSLKHEVA